jgi:hypothetical protein
MRARLLWNRQHIRLVSALLAVACVARGRARVQDANAGASDQLAVIAAACRDNTERIASLQVSGTVVLTGRRFGGMRDPFSGQNYDSQNRSFSAWRNTLGNARLDVTADRHTDGKTSEIRYNVPYGDHITSCRKLEREGGWADVEREYGTPQTTRRMIVTPSVSYWYEPECNQLYLDDPRLAALDDELEMQLVLNRMPDAGTGADVLDRWAAMADRPGRSVTLMELGGGLYHAQLTIDTLGAEGHGALHTRDIVVDLERGGNIVSYAARTDGKVVDTGQFDYMNVGGAWVVTHAEYEGGIGPDGVPMMRAVYDVQPESVQVNQPIDPRIFSFGGLDVRRGALVRDYKADEQYLYDDVPIDVKVALAAEREREEEAAASAKQQDAQGPEQAAPQEAPARVEIRASSPPKPAEAGQDASSSTFTLLTPEPARVREASTRPTGNTRVIAVPPKAAAPATPEEGLPSRLPASVTRLVPSRAVTITALSAACAAALAAGIWRWTRARS